jgi:hypothetical protein
MYPPGAVGFQRQKQANLFHDKLIRQDLHSHRARGMGVSRAA